MGIIEGRHDGLFQVGRAGCLPAMLVCLVTPTGEEGTMREGDNSTLHLHDDRYASDDRTLQVLLVSVQATGMASAASVKYVRACSKLTCSLISWSKAHLQSNCLTYLC
jgi:hypothetical protein